ncbi:hypothetical protein GCM10020001_020220 [Nonomuraea salmonea]
MTAAVRVTVSAVAPMWTSLRCPITIMSVAPSLGPAPNVDRARRRAQSHFRVRTPDQSGNPAAVPDVLPTERMTVEEGQWAGTTTSRSKWVRSGSTFHGTASATASADAASTSRPPPDGRRHVSVRLPGGFHLGKTFGGRRRHHPY